MRITVILCVVLTLSGGSAFATSYTWGGTATGSWQLDTNWSPNTSSGSGPGATDDVVIFPTGDHPITLSATGNVSAHNFSLIQNSAYAMAGLFTADCTTTKLLTCDTAVFLPDMVGSVITVGGQSRTIQTYNDSQHVVLSALGAVFTNQSGASIARTAVASLGASNSLDVKGDLYVRSDTDLTVKEINAYGNVLVTIFNSANTTETYAWNLRGTNQVFRNVLSRVGTNINVYGTGAVDNGCFQQNDNRNVFTVMSGARLGNGASTSNGWSASTFDFKGGQSNLPDWGSKVNFTYVGNVLDNGLTRYAVAGGLLYPNNVTIYEGNNGKATGLVYRVKGGGFTVAQDFTITMYTGAVGGALRDGGDFQFSSLENNTTGSVDFNVGRGMVVGNLVAASTGALVSAKFNNSTVHIGDCLTFGLRSDSSYLPNGTGNLGGATIYLGGDLRIYDPHPAKDPTYTKTVDNWNAGTSTIICDGNGTSAIYGRKNQIITTYSYKTGTGGSRFALNNLIIRNECGTVSLANGPEGQLYLTGNLRLEKGRFNDNLRGITFNGPSHVLFWDNALCRSINGRNSLDNINLLANSVLRLDGGTSAAMKFDNLNMGSGSTLYLNGIKLWSDGLLYDGTQTGRTWVSDRANHNGTILALSNVPEPATLLSLGSAALAGLGWLRRRRTT